MTATEMYRNVSTHGGYKTHYARHGSNITLCGRWHSSGDVITIDLCKRCEKIADSIAELRAVQLNAQVAR